MTNPQESPHVNPELEKNRPVVEIIPPSHKVLPYKKQPKPLATISISILAVATVGALTYSALAYRQQTKKDTDLTADKVELPTGSPSLPATPTPEAAKTASLLTGLPAEPGKENVHPLAVMIENHPDARPQSGLSQADLVYEAIAEGGITRFMAVFGDPTQAIKVGPVRSARPYFVDLAEELNAFYAHVGGNLDALNQIKNNGVLDLDQFRVGEPTYKRELGRPVALEHTMYSSTEKLWNYATEINKWSKTGDYKTWSFQDDALLEQRPSSQKVSINVSENLYAVTWDYDQTSNSYARNMAGTPHLDANTGKQIRVKNIVLQTVERQPSVTKINEHGWKYFLTGSGKAQIIQNGTKIEGTWKKEGADRTRFYDGSGQEIRFVKGSTWVQLVHPDSLIN